MIEEKVHKSRQRSRGKRDDGTPNPVDIYVGERVRLRRHLLGLSQQELSRRLGITFQQIQKYEKGCNRLGASRLWDISRVLKVGVEYFFQDMPEDIFRESPRALFGLDDGKDEQQGDFPLEYRTDAQQLLLYYNRIQQQEHRKLVIDVARGLSV